MSSDPPADSVDLDRTFSLWSSSEGASAPALLAGRYRLLDVIGKGGGGQVFAAMDELEGREVAVKCVRVSGPGGQARVRREVAALRLLDLPGVVHIVDDGQVDGEPFVVMDLVPGQPFPGRDRAGDWDALRAPTLALLQTLARVHDAGVVHRDIKPANVLVSDAGDPVLLDFGLARGQSVGTTVTTQGMVLGTPRYLSPEQLVGEAITPATDLYAVGVMLYQALAGCLPFEHDDMDALWRAKLLSTPVPLGRLVPMAPRAVTDAIMSLLARRAQDRPASAEAAIAALGGGLSAHHLPWLGSKAPIDAVCAALIQGCSVTIGGVAGAGASRVLQEAAAVLTGDGRQVTWTVPGSSPFESLVPVLGDPGDLRGEGDLRAILEARLAGLLGAGLILLVDDLDALDRWSRGLVQNASGALGLAGGQGHAQIMLQALSVTDLHGLFTGPDRFLHLREDAATELYRRTGGVAAQASAEVRAWIRSGLAEWKDGRVLVSRPALDRLRSGTRVRALAGALSSPHIDPELADLLAWFQLAGPHADAALLAEVTGRPQWQVELEIEELVRLGAVERTESGNLQCITDRDLAAAWPGPFRRDAHGALATALPVGAQGRLFHLLAAGLSQLVADEAVALARRQRSAGRVGQAEAALLEALRAIRRDHAPGEAALLSALVRTAVAAAADPAIERARYEIMRCDQPDPRLLAVLDASRDARRGQVDRALQALDAFPTFPETDLELARQATRLQAAQRADPGLHAEVLSALQTWSAQSQDQEMQARLPGWEGLLAFREGRYADAARLHERSADLRTERLGRTSALVNAAMAWLEACDLERALVVADQARILARDARAPVYEARATWVARSVAARRADPLAPDLDLVEAAEALGHAELAGTVAFTEGVLAWRAQDRALAQLLGVRAQAHFVAARIGPAVLMSQALCVAAAPGEAQHTQAMADRATRCPLAVVGVETLGVLASVGQLKSDRVQAAQALAAKIPEDTWEVARAMMPVVAALEWVREAARHC